jgi:hypothetical protein
LKWWLSKSCSLALIFLSFTLLAFSEEAEKVSVCQLKSNPPAFNHKLVEVTSFVSHGFEDFTLQEPSCGTWPDIWLEYGGVSASGTMYCCGVTNARTRPQQLEIEGISIPLVTDDNFRKFDQLLQVHGTYAMAHGTIIGRFFAGKEALYGKEKQWRGYGHMGCCSLLVIQQVISVDDHERDDLDYESYVDQPDLEKLKCGSYRNLTPINHYRETWDAQEKAESPDGDWAFHDPLRVALSGLAAILKVDEKSITGLKVQKKTQGKVIYEWKPAHKKERYMLVVNRPYWLSYLSKNGQVAWVLAAAYEECNN